MATRTILSIDGGGIRGIIPAKVLQTVEERTGRRIASLFHYLAGTSTGGILALRFTKPNDANSDTQHSAGHLVEFYDKNDPTIFSPALWYTIEAVGNLTG